MMYKLSIACAAAILVVTKAGAVIPVTVDAIVDPSFIFNQSQQLLNVVATAKQTYDIYQQAQRLNEMLGDPKKALNAMVDLSPLMNDINRQLSGGTSYLSGLDGAQQFMTDLEGGVDLRLRLLPADPNAAARDDERIRATRKIFTSGGQSKDADAKLYSQLDEAEAIGRSLKSAVVAQNKAREQAGKSLGRVNDAMAKAQTESEKQALAAQYSAINAQMTMLNGQLQQQQFEYQLQKDKDQRTADDANLTDQQQAVSDATATAQASDARAARAQQNQQNSRTLVTGNPIDLDYSKIR